jgi:hypothetical protein
MRWPSLRVLQHMLPLNPDVLRTGPRTTEPAAEHPTWIYSLQPIQNAFLNSLN